jgi:3-hydroxyisobutyrate dehydrogenase-like beta-hydroxyacid dehydrogenase
MAGSREQVGFVGLGNQGGPIAMRIVRAGFPVRVFARRPGVTPDYVAEGATVAGSLSELGNTCDLVAVCVTTDADVRAVVLGPAGVLAAMRAGSSLAVHSTVHPDLVREIAGTAAARDVAVLDAPVSGGNTGARAGTLAVMVGGDAAVLARWQPVLDSFARTVELLGPVGSGQLAKLVNNALSASNLAAALRATAAAEALGLDPEAVRRVVQDASGDSFMLRMVPLMLQHGGQLAADLFRKDVGLFQDIVDTAGTTSGAALAETAQSAVGYLETSLEAAVATPTSGR